MTPSEIYAHLADLAAQIDRAIRAPGQAPSNRAHLRYTRDKITDAISAMELVNSNPARAAMGAR